MSTCRARRSLPRAAPGLKPRARWLVLLAALLTFSWQSVVAQTHWHSPSEAGSRAIGQAAHGQSGQRHDPGDSPASCPLCRELAHAHYFLPPAPIVLAAPKQAVSLEPAAVAFGAALPQRSHIWRSRAPPLQLQA